MTSIVWAYPEEAPLIYTEGLGKIEGLIEEWGYSGTIDLNTIVNEEGVWGLEWTPRFGYNALFALLELFEDDVSSVLLECASGELKGNLPISTELVAYALRVYLPPAPFVDFITGDITERLKSIEKRGEDVKSLAEALGKAGIEVSFKRGTGELKGVCLKEVSAGEQVIIPDSSPATIWLLDVKIDARNNKMVTAGLDGIICEVSASRSKLSEAVSACEFTVKSIHLPNKCWRNDGSLRFIDAAKLQGMGYNVPRGVLT